MIELKIKSIINTYEFDCVDLDGLEYHVYVPFYLSSICTNPKIGDTVLASIDRNTGNGVLIDSITSPFSYKINHDININGNLTVTSAKGEQISGFSGNLMFSFTPEICAQILACAGGQLPIVAIEVDSKYV